MMSTLLANSLIKKNNNQACESDQAKQNRLNAKALHERVEKERTEKEVKVFEAKGFLVINANDLSDLESKQPVLYKQIYQKGEKEGKEKEASFNKIMAKVNEKKVLTKEQVPEKDFEALVAEYQEEHKCRKGRAIMFVANSHPEEHKKYIQKTNESRKENIVSRNGPESKFKTLMNEYQAEHKCSKLEALKACGKLYPDKFKAPRKENIGSRNGTESRFKLLVDEYQEEHKCSKLDAMRVIVQSHPEEHAKYIAA